jgi:hypothetical protein
MVLLIINTLQPEYHSVTNLSREMCSLRELCVDVLLHEGSLFLSWLFNNAVGVATTQRLISRLDLRVRRRGRGVA